jgi:hypothetical protein
VREMGQSAWLNTSSLTLQGLGRRVNVREIGKESNDWILWGNIYSVWPVSGRKVETFRKDRPVARPQSAIGLPVRMQDAQKSQTSHPPNPGAPRRALT